MDQLVKKVRKTGTKSTKIVHQLLEFDSLESEDDIDSVLFSSRATENVFVEETVDALPALAAGSSVAHVSDLVAAPVDPCQANTPHRPPTQDPNEGVVAEHGQPAQVPTLPLTSAVHDVPVVPGPHDLTERGYLDVFLERGCGCSSGPGNSPCCQQFSRQFVEKQRNQCHELSKAELDMVLLGNFEAHRRQREFVDSYAAHSKDRGRGKHSKSSVYQFRPCTKFFFADLQLCKKTFAFLHTVGEDRLDALRKHHEEHGLVPRTHGNTGKKNAGRVISSAETVDIVNFLTKLAETVAIPLPGRLPQHRDFRVMKLPSDMTKASVYTLYSTRCQEADKLPVGRTAFFAIWDQHVPFIAAMKPSSDLCPTCHDNNTAVLRAKAMPEGLQNEKLRIAQEHLRQAATQRSHYQQQCDESKQEFQRSQAANVPPDLMHYSFDYAQNVQYPYSPQQLGPAYFKSMRKCGIFGVHCEGTGHQVNYLVDECENVGKGANTVVSMLHHYLATNTHQARNISLHCDNCCGQNKNNCVVQYCCWRVLAGLNDSIELNFLLTGHTKFAPDRSFGLIKRLYGRTVVDTLDDIVNVVGKSSPAGLNSAVVTYDYASGQRNVQWYDFSSFLSDFLKPVPHVLSYHHFAVTLANPGTVQLRTFADQESTSVKILKGRGRRVPLDLGPHELVPTGLEPARQWYLFQEIAPLCSSTLSASITCPEPDCSRPKKAK